jgi:phospholipase/carboxylesterase
MDSAQSSPRSATAAGLPFLYRPAQEPDRPTVCLLHGLGGDETSMWVFSHALPPRWGVVVPRGAFAHTAGGYSWTAQGDGPDVSAFDSSAQRLWPFLKEAAGVAGSDPARPLWLGFSQGGALAVAAVWRGVPAVACAVLAGFVPDGAEGRWPGAPVFWSHGTRDEDVPLARARDDILRLRSMGAQVDFCEADVDHRVGAACMSALSRWIHRLPVSPADRPSGVS